MSKGKLINPHMSDASFQVTFLLVNSLTWLFIERRNLGIILNKIGVLTQGNFIIWGVWDLAIISSGIIGAVFSTKIKKSLFLYLWTISGVLASSLIYCLQYLQNSLYVIPLSFFWGLSFGIGMPSCLSYFAEQTTFENRGAISGLVFFITSSITPLVISTSGMNFALSLISIGWRATSFMVLITLGVKENSSESKKAAASFKSILSDKNIALYLVPWFMFSFVYGFQKVTIEQTLPADFYDLLKVIQAASAMISAVIIGILCDRIGRKHVVTYGFILLGIAYAVVSIAPYSSVSFYFYSLVDGIAWSIFIIMFVLTLWGDLSVINAKSAEKYYAIGSIPFFFADFIGFLFAAYMQAPISTAFSIASFFLFLAVVPLMYAPETLPEKKRRERELKEYIERAKKVREKFT
jgi:hypothetical protein